MKTNFKFLATMLIGILLSSNVWGEDVTYDFNSSMDNYPSGFPTATGTAATTAQTFTIDGKTIKILAPTAYYVINSNTDASRALFFGKTSSSSIAAYLEFPARSGYKITKIVATTSGGIGGSIAVNVFNASGSAMSTAINTVTQTSKELSFTLSNPAENTAYRLSSKTNGKNLQFYSVVVTYTSTGPSCTTNPTVSAGAISGATTSSLTFNCAGGITSLGSTGCSITEYGYVYGTSSNPTTSSTKHKVGESYTTTGTAFTAYTATGLNCGTTYYMRPYAINGNGTAYGTQATLSTSACLVDHFIDNIQETTGYTGDGKAVSTSFTKASITLSDKAATTSGSCEDVHYHFVGWVTEADRSAGNVDAGHIVNFQDSGNVPTGTTYYAVWAKEAE